MTSHTCYESAALTHIHAAKSFPRMANVTR
jgi:hypothetical protein